MGDSGSGETQKSPGWFWLLWLFSLLVALPIILFSLVIGVMALSEGEYLESVYHFALFAVSSALYWNTARIADSWWRRGESRQWILGTSLGVPGMIYWVLDRYYF